MIFDFQVPKFVGNGAQIRRNTHIKAEIAHLDLEHRPQPGQAPLDAPIARTQEALEGAKRSFQQTQTEKIYKRREKYHSNSRFRKSLKLDVIKTGHLLVQRGH